MLDCNHFHYEVILDISCIKPPELCDVKTSDTDLSAIAVYLLSTGLYSGTTLEFLIMKILTYGLSSKFSWNMVAMLGYETNWWGFTPSIGWRTMYLDYEDGSGNDFFQYKVWMNGIMAGAGFRF